MDLYDFIFHCRSRHCRQFSPLFSPHFRYLKSRRRESKKYRGRLKSRESSGSESSESFQSGKRHFRDDSHCSPMTRVYDGRPCPPTDAYNTYTIYIQKRYCPAPIDFHQYSRDEKGERGKRNKSGGRSEKFVLVSGRKKTGRVADK